MLSISWAYNTVMMKTNSFAFGCNGACCQAKSVPEGECIPRRQAVKNDGIVRAAKYHRDMEVYHTTDSFSVRLPYSG